MDEESLGYGGAYVMANTEQEARDAFEKRYGCAPEKVRSWNQWWYAGPIPEEMLQLRLPGMES